jgi:ATP-dependent Clp protease ATP-binding subunit ClpA
LLAAPTGVGKTEVTRQLARLLGLELIRDMSEYMAPQRLTLDRRRRAVGFDQGAF